MSINTSYYGTQEDGLEVYNFTYYGHNIVIKSPAWANSGNYIQQGSYLAKAVADSSAIKSEIDTSIAHCGIGQKGDFLEWTYTDREGNEQTEILTAHYDHYLRHMHWLSLKREWSISTPQGNVTVSFGIDKDDDYNGTYSSVDIPVWLTKISTSSSNNQLTFSATQYTDSTVPSYYNWGSDETQTYSNTISNSLGYNSPLIQYGLGDMVFVIYVYCSSNNTGSNAQRVQLADYINPDSTYNYTNRPYVGSVYATPATWSSGSAGSRGLSLTTTFVPSFNRKFSITAPYYSTTKPNTDGTKSFYYYDMQQSFFGTGGSHAYGMYNIFCTSNINNGASWTTESQSYPLGILPSGTPVQTYHYYYVAGYDFWENCGFGELRTGGTSGSYSMDTCILHVQTQSQANKLKQYAFEMCAYLGVFFSDRTVTATVDTTLSEEEQWKQAFTDDNIYCGIIDENGLTHGFYTHGMGNTETMAYGNTNAQNVTPYKPTKFNPDIKPKPVAPTKEKASDPLTLRPNANIGIGMGLMRYAVKSNDLFNMGVWLNAVSNYNKAVNSFVSKYVTDNPTANENKAMKAFKNVFPDVNSWYAYVYSKLGNGVHPNNNIVGLMAFPFETNKFGVGTATGILMGDSNTGSSPQFECKSWYEDESPINTTFTLSDITTAVGKPVNSDGFAVLDMGSMFIQPEYGDFRDYAPYTKLELQIPYFGTVDLDPKEWYYHNVYVKCICECVTGSALCIVCRENDDDNDIAPVYTIGGQLGFSIPLNIDSYGGTTASLTASSASFQNMNVEHRVNAVNGLIDVGKSTALLIGAGAFTVATGGLGVGALALAGANTTQKASSYYGQMKTEKNNIKATEYAMEHQQAGSMIHGSASPSANGKYEYQCRLVKHYPCMLNTSLSEFIANNGVACNESGVVRNYSGYTVFSNVKLDNINLTDEEKKIIETTLQSGVYI